MLVNNKKRQFIGNLTEKDLPFIETDMIFKYIIDNINTFRTECNHYTNEDGLNSNFVIYLNRNTKEQLFFFHHEYPEDPSTGQSHKVDIAVIPYSKDKKVTFVIEAKRLDINIEKKREKEYVIGNTGGIERFKRDKHGRGFLHAGMIGYMQSNDFKTWEDKINSWIGDEIKKASSKDLTWSTSDKLIKIESNLEFSKYKSCHLCLSSKKILLTHLWINLIN